MAGNGEGPNLCFGPRRARAEAGVRGGPAYPALKRGAIEYKSNPIGIPFPALKRGAIEYKSNPIGIPFPALKRGSIESPNPFRIGKTPDYHSWPGARGASPLGKSQGYPKSRVWVKLFG